MKILPKVDLPENSVFRFRNRCGFDVRPGMKLGLACTHRAGLLGHLVSQHSRRAVMCIVATDPIRNGRVGVVCGPRALWT